MPVTIDELRRYDAFILSIATELGCMNPPPSNSLLWHYTNGQGLLGIVQSGTLYSTQISCLNDSEEIKYASRLFTAALARLKEEGGEDPAIVDAALKYFQTDDDYVGSAPYFVACFTELEDSISQWQGYGARGENGYAIGFDPEALKQMGGLLARVNYDKVKHEEMALRIAKATVGFYRAGLSAHRENTADRWAQEFIAVWDQKITQLAPLVKDPCWAHEEEYRVVRLLIQGQLRELLMLQKDTMMTRHLPLRMTSDWRHPMLPIKRVVVGPCPHPSISRVSVDTALRQHQYPAGLVIPSKRPYRKT